MSEAATKLLEQLLQLPEADRRHIADRLRESVGDGADDAEGLLPDDPEFQAELQRRLDSVASGTAELIPWEQAREEMRAELERRRAARIGSKP